MTSTRGLPPGAKIAGAGKPGPEGVKIELPLPPSINAYYALNWKTHQYYISKAGWAFRRRVQQIVVGLPQFGDARLAILVDAYPRRTNADLDNFHKPLLDALEHAGLFTNDKQVDDLRIRRQHRLSGGRVEVHIWEL